MSSSPDWGERENEGERERELSISCSVEGERREYLDTTPQ
jgi:hypothetical protein